MSDKGISIFLASAEHRGEWSRVRRCSIVGRITDVEGRNYLWVRVDPPVIGQPYGLGNRDIADLLLLPHYEGTSLFPMSKFPLPVYIFRALDDGIFKDLPASSKYLQLAAWGEIYQTREEAEAVASRNSPNGS